MTRRRPGECKTPCGSFGAGVAYANASVSLPLSRHVAAWELGLAPSVCLIVTYANAADMPTVEWLKQRIFKLHSWYPFMTATFEQPAMLHEVQAAEIDYNWLIQQRSIEEGKAEARRVRAQGGIADDDHAPDVLYLLEAEAQRWIRVFRTGKPMWQVVRYLSASALDQATDTGHHENAYLAVTISHALADGVGCQEAVKALLESDEAFEQRPKSIS